MPESLLDLGKAYLAGEALIFTFVTLVILT
jgi:hypothetical protein